jgi:glucosylceramidase
MKTNKQMSCFPLGPLDCALVPEFQPAYALYFSRYLSAYKAAGVDVWGVTVQNEPQPQTGTLTYEGMWFPFTAELEFVAEYLGPQLEADHPDVKIFIFDHNQADALWYAAPILADPVASRYVAGVAFHWYSGPDWGPLDELARSFPNALLLASEATVGREDRADFFKPSAMVWAHGEYYGTFILNDLLHNSVGFIDWNVLLDQYGGPDHGGPDLCEGLIKCGSDAMLIADLSASPPVVYKQAMYWYMAHVSRFVPPGSVRLGATLARVGGSNSTTPLLGVPFATPGGGTALVLQNGLDTHEMVAVDDAREGHLGWIDLPPHSIVTLTW